MANGATGYNLVHLQAAAKSATPTFSDINYATTAEFTIDQGNEYFRADGGVKVNAYGAREGSGSIGFGSADLQTIALISGDTFSTTGTGATLVDSLIVSGSTQPPSLILSAWIPNVDGNSTSAGLQVSIPNAKVAMPSTSFEQESWTEFTADLAYSADENDTMQVWQSMATAPTFTAGVIPVNLAP